MWVCMCVCVCVNKVCEHELMDENLFNFVFLFYSFLFWLVGGVYLTIRFNKCVHVNVSMVSDEVIIPF